MINEKNDYTLYEEEVLSQWRSRGNKARNFLENNNYIKLLSQYLDLAGEQDFFPYVDPDSDKLNICSYYSELTDYLNLVEGNGGWVFERPKGCKSRNENENDNNNIKIAVKEKGKIKFWITSDQFGFSADRGALFNKKYPYGCLYEYAKFRADKWKIYELIAECILKTRTLGGGFVWPVMKKSDGTGTNYCTFNCRGVDTYIEDRVDVTLLEIKKYYSNNDEEKKSSFVFEKVNADKRFGKWFDHFLHYVDADGSSYYGFKSYVKYFGFDDFVMEENGDCWPIDIIESDLENNKKVSLKDNNGKKIKDISSVDDLKRMVKNVRKMTIERSKLMSKIVSA